MYIVVLYCSHTSLGLKLRVEGGAPEPDSAGWEHQAPKDWCSVWFSEAARLRPLEPQTKGTEPASPTSSSEEEQKQKDRCWTMQAGWEQAGWEDKCKAMSLGQRVVHAGPSGPAGHLTRTIL